MVENDDLESFSQNFSQFSLGDDIFQINSQTVDPTIFDQCTPELEFLCETNENILKQINNSETENLIGFLEGEAVVETNIISLSPQLTCSDSFLSFDEKSTLNLHLKNEVSSSGSDDSKENLQIKIESSPVNVIESMNKNDLNSQDFKNHIFFADTCSTYEKSPNLNIERSTSKSSKIDVLKLDGDIKTQENVVLKTQIHEYIECKTKKCSRGRPIKSIHVKPNLHKINDPGKLKYVSRRYKNNIASQHSRIKRNLKGKELKKEHEKLEQKRDQLKQEKEKWKSLKVKLVEEIRIKYTSL